MLQGEVEQPHPAKANASKMLSPVLTTSIAKTEAHIRPGIRTCFRPYLSDKKPSTGAPIIPIPAQKSDVEAGGEVAEPQFFLQIKGASN